MRITQKEGKLLGGFWIPTALIEMGLDQSPIPVPQAQRDQMVNLLNQFVIVFVTASTTGPMGGVNPKTEDDIRMGIRLIDSAGRSVSPLSDSSVPADVKMLAAAIKANSGVSNEMFRLLVFPGTDKDGKVIADPRREGSFRLRLDDQEIDWKLPLGSFLPPKTCPVDGEMMNGAWRYCPWHGSELGPAGR